MDEFFNHESTAWLAQRRFQRVGLEVASLGGLALQAFSILILLKKQTTMELRASRVCGKILQIDQTAPNPDIS